MRLCCIIVGAACALPAAVPAAVITGQLSTPVYLNYSGYNPPAAEIRRFDLDADGVNDLEFNYFFHPNIPEWAYALVRTPSGVGGGVAFSGLGSGPAADADLAHGFAAGDTVGPASTFGSWVSLMMIHRSGLEPVNGYAGVWADGATHTAGFRFADGQGNLHYGWFRAQMDFENLSLFTQVPNVALLFDYAYESVPGVGIAVPAPPASAAAVLMSVGVLASVRRRRSR